MLKPPSTLCLVAAISICMTLARMAGVIWGGSTPKPCATMSQAPCRVWRQSACNASASAHQTLGRSCSLATPVKQRTLLQR